MSILSCGPSGGCGPASLLTSKAKRGLCSLQCACAVCTCVCVSECVCVRARAHVRACPLGVGSQPVGCHLRLGRGLCSLQCVHTHTHAHTQTHTHTCTHISPQHRHSIQGVIARNGARCIVLPGPNWLARQVVHGLHGQTNANHSVGNVAHPEVLVHEWYTCGCVCR